MLPIGENLEKEVLGHSVTILLFVSLSKTFSFQSKKRFHEIIHFKNNLI